MMTLMLVKPTRLTSSNDDDYANDDLTMMMMSAQLVLMMVLNDNNIRINDNDINQNGDIRDTMTMTSLHVTMVTTQYYWVTHHKPRTYIGVVWWHRGLGPSGSVVGASLAVTLHLGEFCRQDLVVDAAVVGHELLTLLVAVRATLWTHRGHLKNCFTFFKRAGTISKNSHFQPLLSTRAQSQKGFTFSNHLWTRSGNLKNGFTCPIIYEHVVAMFYKHPYVHVDSFKYSFTFSRHHWTPRGNLKNVFTLPNHLWTHRGNLKMCFTFSKHWDKVKHCFKFHKYFCTHSDNFLLHM